MEITPPEGPGRDKQDGVKKKTFCLLRSQISSQPNNFEHPCTEFL